MNYALAADAVVFVHALFVVYAVFGALLVLKWPWTAVIHIPCVIWGAWIEFSGTVCPLTPLEIHFRELAGEQGYAGGFISHYLVPILYPDDLTGPDQVALGVAFLCLNAALYVLVLRNYVSSSRGPKR